jgi:uncharacterized protein (TIGR03437 family)
MRKPGALPGCSATVVGYYKSRGLMRVMRDKSQFRVAALALFFVAVAAAQTQDTSGNSQLNGSYRFRHVAVLNVDGNFDPSEIQATFGVIAFDGAGHYTITGTTADNTVSSGASKAFSVTGTYAIGSSGAGYIANPLFPSDPNTYINGAVAQGVFTGSSTESELEGAVMNDLFIAIPIAAAAPTNASFTSSYQTGLIDFTGGGATAIKNALFTLSPNGSGGFGTISLKGQASNLSASTVTQSISGASYNFNSDGSATLTVPLPTGVNSTNALFTGSKTIFESKDGNFILGWTAGGYDLFFGIKALPGTGANSLTGGLYFSSALEDFQGVNGTDSYFGGFSSFGDSTGDAIVHERVNSLFGLSYDFGTDDQVNLNSAGITTTADYDGYLYSFGNAGTCQAGTTTFPCALAYVAIGTNGFYSLQVGIHAPIFSGSGVYLYPTGVVNAASYAPITASIAPGELLTLFGTGLASATLVTQGGQQFPTTGLGGVTVTINNLACPVYYVSATQLAVIVPYAVAANQTGLANIQVNNKGVLSNIVQMYLTDAAPGAFSQATNGIGLGAILHAATGLEVTATNPAQPGEYLSVFLTGLGTVSPVVNDGALGPVPLSYSDVYNAGNLAVYFNDYNSAGSVGNQGTIQFAGLAPFLAGLYQINVQVPTSGLGPGDDVYIEIVTDAADIDQIQFPYGG